MEGLDEGCIEGLGVGCIVGWVEGFVEGCIIGWVEGSIEGLVEGLDEGWIEVVGCIDMEGCWEVTQIAPTHQLSDTALAL